MNVVFLKSKTFLAQEVENALKKRRDIQLITTAIPEHIPSETCAIGFRTDKALSSGPCHFHK
jgi:hypothetical protein